MHNFLLSCVFYSVLYIIVYSALQCSQQWCEKTSLLREEKKKRAKGLMGERIERGVGLGERGRADGQGVGMP